MGKVRFAEKVQEKTLTTSTIVFAVLKDNDGNIIKGPGLEGLEGAKGLDEAKDGFRLVKDTPPWFSCVRKGGSSEQSTDEVMFTEVIFLVGRSSAELATFEDQLSEGEITGESIVFYYYEKDSTKDGYTLSSKTTLEFYKVTSIERERRSKDSPVYIKVLSQVMYIEVFIKNGSLTSRFQYIDSANLESETELQNLIEEVTGPIPQSSSIAASFKNDLPLNPNQDVKDLFEKSFFDILFEDEKRRDRYCPNGKYFLWKVPSKWASNFKQAEEHGISVEGASPNDCFFQLETLFADPRKIEGRASYQKHGQVRKTLGGHAIQADPSTPFYDMVMLSRSGYTPIPAIAPLIYEIMGKGSELPDWEVWVLDHYNSARAEFSKLSKKITFKNCSIFEFCPNLRSFPIMVFSADQIKEETIEYKKGAKKGTFDQITHWFKRKSK